MKNMAPKTEHTMSLKIAAPGGQSAPAGADWPPGAGGRGSAPAAPPDPEVTVKKPRRNSQPNISCRFLRKLMIAPNKV